MANTAYSVEDFVVPTTANGFQYRCTVAGTSHASVEPTWGTVLGVTQTDGTVTWEMDGNAGDEYSRNAPLKVKAQELINANGQTQCQFDAFGLTDQLALDKALTEYSQTAEDTNTVKDLINAIAGATLAPYTHTTAVTVTYDSEDSLIDSFAPNDSFHVVVGDTRLAKIRELLDWTRCVVRDENDGELHIFVPTILGNTWEASTAYVLQDYVQPTSPNDNFTYRCTTAGTSDSSEPTFPTTAGNTVNDGTAVWTAVGFDYEYEDDYGGSVHPFFSKIYRTRLVIPNKFVVQSPKGATPQYEGSATSAASFALLPFTEPKVLRIASNAQGTAIAVALIQRAELDHERGSLSAPPNVGAELHDFVKVTDNVEGNNRIGNVGYLTSIYEEGAITFHFGFGNILLGASIGLEELGTGKAVTDAPVRTTVSSAQFRALNIKVDVMDVSIRNQTALIEGLISLMEQRQISVPKWWVTEELRIPVV